LNTFTEAKPTPLSHFIGSEGGNKSTPATWNKVTPNASAPAVLNGPLPKPTPPANACSFVFLFRIFCYEYVSLGATPIKIKAAPVVVVKKETPSEDYSLWGQKSATSPVDQKTICESSLQL
jgi:hypothetical protein